MGLDIRLSVRRNGATEDDAETLFEGNGRSAFAFVREYVEWYSEETAHENMYGKDIWLEDFDMVNDLIMMGAEQLAETEGVTVNEMLNRISFAAPEDLYGATAFIHLLMALSFRMGLKDIGIAKSGERICPPTSIQLFIEADW